MYRACMDRNRFQFLLQCLCFYDNNRLRQDYLTDVFAKGRVLLDKFERNCREYYRHHEFVCLDETLINCFASNNCDFLVFMPDKPGQMGIFFYTLADVKDRFFTRIIPKVKRSISEKERKIETKEIVINITEDLHNSARSVCADRGFSAIDIAEELYEKRLTYVGTIMKNRRGLPTKAVKNAHFKEREVLSTEFYWKQNSPVMCLSYKAKKNKNVLLISTEHDQPTIDDTYRSKPDVILYYNEQRCAVDVVNHMLRDTKCQSKTDSWEFILFTFLLDLGSINAMTFLKYAKKLTGIERRSFTKNLIMQLCMPFLKIRSKLPYLKSQTKLAIRDIRAKHDPDYVNDARPEGMKNTPAKCYLCMEDILNMKPGVDKRKKTKNTKPVSWYCPKCNIAVCPKHRAKLIPSLQIVCDNCYLGK